MTAKRPEKFLQLTKIILHGFKVFGLAPFSVQAKNLFANFGKPVCIWAFSFSKIGLVYNLLLAILIPIAYVLLVPKFVAIDYEHKTKQSSFCDVAWSIVAISTVWVVIVSWTFKQSNAVIIMNRLIDVDFRLSLTNGPNIRVPPSVLISLFITEYFFIVGLLEAEFYRVNNMLLKCKDFHYLSSAIPFLSSGSEISDLSNHNQLSALRSLRRIRKANWSGSSQAGGHNNDTGNEKGAVMMPTAKMTAKRPEKFLQLTKIILHGFKVFSLAPFSVQAKNLFANFGKPVCIWAFSFSKIGLVYNLLLAILIPIAYVLLVPKYLVADYEEKFQLRLSCDIAWSIVAISTVWVVIVSWTFKQNNAVIIMNRLIDTDFRLSLKKGPNITDLPFMVARVAKEIFLTFVIAYPVILLVYNVPKTVNEAKRTGLVIHKLMDATAIPVIKAELTEFSLRILHEELNFTAYGFFRLDFTLLHSMLAALVTYLVILVQYSG
ncbi:uncharacterized protein [Neodiprion pinetum]|uniref:uncharacterized protein n=1 Tax=Neodiprion pinetum TaxID=441929 RepID=UPI0037110E60